MKRKKSRQVEFERSSLLFCDLTQSWSEQGGGVRTYLLRKRRHILERTPHRHLLVIPGARDEVVEEGRAITVTIASPKVPGSPNYRLLLRNGAVAGALRRYRPDLIECQDAYNLPWAAIAYRRRNPGTALTAAYMTDFPTVYVEKPFTKVVGRRLARLAARICYSYCRRLYGRFDRIFALSEHGGAVKLRALGIDRVEVIGLGVDTGDFGAHRRDPELRRSLGLREGEPLLIYVGRLDREKKPDVVVDAFRMLPPEIGARLALLGDGPLRADIEAFGDRRIVMPGFLHDRAELSRWLASADLYVSGMADETFGISVVEAQASGLPVVGVAAGAMLDRVPEGLGRIGPVGDAAAMARNIVDALDERGDGSAERAIAEAARYDWDRIMDALFTGFYPRALERRGEFPGERRRSAVAAT